MTRATLKKGSDPNLALAVAFEFLRSAVACAGLGEFQLSTSNVSFFRCAFERLLCFVLGRKCGRFVKLVAAQSRVSKYRHRVRLYFEHAAE